jgi:hypothetical protein
MYVCTYVCVCVCVCVYMYMYVCVHPLIEVHYTANQTKTKL